MTFHSLRGSSAVGIVSSGISPRAGMGEAEPPAEERAGRMFQEVSEILEPDLGEEIVLGGR